jgi:hypothetical protein
MSSASAASSVVNRAGGPGLTDSIGGGRRMTRR